MNLHQETTELQTLAKKCIHDHRHPIVKVTMPPQKLFFPAKNEEEKTLIEEHQNQLINILEHQRVEKRSSRAIAIWLADQGVAKVTKVVKNLVKYFGYQTKMGLFLYPEEMLYLLETNRLEVMFGNTTLTIKEAYEIVLKIPSLNLAKYRVYKKLAILGYKLIRFEKCSSKTLHRIKRLESKRGLGEVESCDIPENKKLKTMTHTQETENDFDTNKGCDMCSSDLKAENCKPKETEYVLGIFNELRDNMPRDCTLEINCINPDYCVFSPTNTLKIEPDFNLFICKDSIIGKKSFNSNIPNIYATCIDDVSFYRFSDIHLPYI